MLQPSVFKNHEANIDDCCITQVWKAIFTYIWTVNHELNMTSGFILLKIWLTAPSFTTSVGILCCKSANHNIVQSEYFEQEVLLLLNTGESCLDSCWGQRTVINTHSHFHTLYIHILHRYGDLKVFKLAFSRKSWYLANRAERTHSTVQLASSAVKINKSLHYGKPTGGTQAAKLQGSGDGQCSTQLVRRLLIL